MPCNAAVVLQFVGVGCVQLYALEQITAINNPGYIFEKSGDRGTKKRSVLSCKETTLAMSVVVVYS